MLTIIAVSLVALVILALVFLYVDDNEVPYVRIVEENDYVPGFGPSTMFGRRLTE